MADEGVGTHTPARSEPPREVHYKGGISHLFSKCFASSELVKPKLPLPFESCFYKEQEVDLRGGVMCTGATLHLTKGFVV